MDDWKKRRREKQKMPTNRNSHSGDFDVDNESAPTQQEQQQQLSRNERRRINRFENSQYYLSPPGEKSNESVVTAPVRNSIEAPPPLPLHARASTIELSGISEALPPVKSAPQETCANDSNMNDSLNMNEQEESSELLGYTYTPKCVSIERPYDYTTRGFGFLLNSGLAATSKSHDPSLNSILGQKYAQIVVVEHGRVFLLFDSCRYSLKLNEFMFWTETLADKAGLKKGDLVTAINDVPTNNLSNEQLRKLMRQRLQANSIQMNLLALEKGGDHNSSKCVCLNWISLNKQANFF